MTDWPATVAPKWAIARNHAATVEEGAIREAPVVPTGGQADRWQAITDTTTIERMPSERRRLCRLEARRVGGRPSLTPQL